MGSNYFSSFMTALKRIKSQVIALSLIIVGGCATHPDISTMPPEEAFRYLQDRYNRGKYAEVIQGLEFYTINYSGSPKVDSAQFLLGSAHQALREYLLAAEAYRELSERFPNSPLVPEAMFREGYCYYLLSPPFHLDQEWTLKAIVKLQNFIETYPQLREQTLQAQILIDKCRNKLGKKIYHSGEIYLKLTRPESAALYFEEIVAKYYDTEWAPKALFQLATIHQNKGDYAQARNALESLLERYPDSPLTDQARLALENLSQGKDDHISAPKSSTSSK
ncbi:MAG: outer membrane protein assembly factor BamD [bacterium]